MLLCLRDFIRKEQFAPMERILRQFGVEQDVLQPMLDFWVRKGVISLVATSTSTCFGCTTCKTSVAYQFGSTSAHH